MPSDSVSQTEPKYWFIQCVFTCGGEYIHIMLVKFVKCVLFSVSALGVFLPLKQSFSEMASGVYKS